MLAVPPIAPLHHESFPTWKKICFPAALVYCLISYILTVLIFCCCRQHIFRLRSLQLSLQIRIQTSIFYIILNNSGFVGLVKRLSVKNFMAFCKWAWPMAGQKLLFFLKWDRSHDTSETKWLSLKSVSSIIKYKHKSIIWKQVSLHK